MTAPTVHVVVPVHGSPADVEACLTSVLRHPPSTDRRVEILVIDDASPGPEISALLEQFLATDPPVPLTVLRNENNLGFVGTVNRAFDHVTGDVVILNSDTVVTDGWLDRMADAAAVDDVATVTPLTNFGSICTLPRSVIDHFDLNGPDPRIDDCARHVTAHGLGIRPDLISGVGFCMYVTRRALDAAGTFDEAAFGKGYGEEVDLCLRMADLGFRHVAEDSTFVYHRGGGSFGDERETRMRAASEVVHARHPGFRDANRAFQRAGRLDASFAGLELGLNDSDDDRPHVLHVLHGVPDDVGGVEKHLASLLENLSDRFRFSLFYPVYPTEHGFVLATLRGDGGRLVTDQRYFLPGSGPWGWETDDPVSADALEMALEIALPDAVHVQNLIRHSLAPLEVLRRFDGPVLCSVRDLYLACPHYWLLYRNQQPCGLPEDRSACEVCLPETVGLAANTLDGFRSTVQRGIDAVDHWVFASTSALDYFRKTYDVDDSRVEIIPHGSLVEVPRDRHLDEGAITDEPLRVAFIGRGWLKKGLPIVNHLADAVAGSDIEIHHFGGMKDPVSQYLHVHGPFDNEVLPEMLRQAGIQVAVLPGMYAETFGHVLTEVFAAGIPAIVTGYGALGERVRGTGAGWMIDPTKPDELVELVLLLDRHRHEVLRATERARSIRVPAMSATVGDYADLYRGTTSDDDSSGEDR